MSNRKRPTGGFAAVLRRARAELGLRQAELAKRLGVAVHTISRWEMGDTVPPRALRQRLVATGLELTPDTRQALLEALGERSKVPASATAAGRAADPVAELDATIYACAEDLDVSARRLRSAFTLLLADMERLGLDAAAARGLIARRRAMPAAELEDT